MRSDWRQMESTIGKEHGHELIERSIAAAPADDEPLTEGEDEALDRADAWLKQNGGRGIPHEEILAEFGATRNDFPLK